MKVKKLIKLSIILLSLVLAFTIQPVNASAAEAPYCFYINNKEGGALNSVNGIPYGYLGDSDWNKTVNIKDVTCIQKFIAGIQYLGNNSRLLADVNLDDNINVKDATAIQKWLANINTKDKVNHIIYAVRNSSTIGNTYYYPESNTISEGQVTVSPYRLFWSDGYLVAECYIINGTQKTINNVCVNHLSFSNANGTFAAGNFTKINATSIPPRKHVTYTFIFSKAAVLNYGADLTTHIYSYSIA